MELILLAGYAFGLFAGTVVALRNVYAWKRKRLAARIRQLEIDTGQALPEENPSNGKVMSTWQPFMYELKGVTQEVFPTNYHAHARQGAIGVAQVVSEEELD